MTQTVAILVDSWRELRSRSLFWVALVISALVAIMLFGTMSFNEKGWRILWFATNESELLRAGSPTARDTMMWVFTGLFVTWWLSWGAIALALVSTASILPDFLAGGAIALRLAKPIGRIRLFALKVLGAFLFVLLQTTIGVVIAFLLLGVKMDIWVPTMLWAIPLLLVQFFYLYSISAFVAVLTRSTLASLLLSVLFWVVIAIGQFSSNQIDEMLAQARMDVQIREERIAAIRAKAAEAGREVQPMEQVRIDTLENGKQASQQQIDTLAPYQPILRGVKTMMPKTGDVRRIISNVSEAPTFAALMADTTRKMLEQLDVPREEREITLEASMRGAKEAQKVDITASLGSSIAVSLATFALAAFIFARKDY